MSMTPLWFLSSLLNDSLKTRKADFEEKETGENELE